MGKELVWKTTTFLRYGWVCQRLTTRRNAAVMELFRSLPSEYRSSHYETKRTLIKSRSNQRKRADRLRRKVDALEVENQHLRRLLKHTEGLLRLHRQLSQTVDSAGSEDATRPCNPLLSDLPITGHQFAARCSTAFAAAWSVLLYRSQRSSSPRSESARYH